MSRRAACACCIGRGRQWEFGGGGGGGGTRHSWVWKFTTIHIIQTLYPIMISMAGGWEGDAYSDSTKKSCTGNSS